MSIVPTPKVSAREHEALLRLLEVAAGNSGQSRMVADFLLAWWNAGSCGAYGITTAWGLDEVLAEDVITVFALASRVREYPDAEAFGRVVAAWRPELRP